LRRNVEHRNIRTSNIEGRKEAGGGRRETGGGEDGATSSRW
jgi:hypothetical protein